MKSNAAVKDVGWKSLLYLFIFSISLKRVLNLKLTVDEQSMTSEFQLNLLNDGVECIKVHLEMNFVQLMLGEEQ